MVHFHFLSDDIVCRSNLIEWILNNPILVLIYFSRLYVSISNLSFSAWPHTSELIKVYVTQNQYVSKTAKRLVNQHLTKILKSNHTLHGLFFIFYKILHTSLRYFQVNFCKTRYRKNFYCHSYFCSFLNKFI